MGRARMGESAGARHAKARASAARPGLELESDYAVVAAGWNSTALFSKSYTSGGVTPSARVYA